VVAVSLVALSGHGPLILGHFRSSQKFRDAAVQRNPLRWTCLLYETREPPCREFHGRFR
jgi:hypothetical protein